MHSEDGGALTALSRAWHGRERWVLTALALALAISMGEAAPGAASSGVAVTPRPVASAPPPSVAPSIADPPEVLAELSGIDHLVVDALAHGKLPGCVVVVGRHDRVDYHKAFGFRELVPLPEPMTEDTIFDLASLTKPIATATSLVILAERGRIGLDDPVVKYIPDFGARGKGAITLRQLLTHVSGLPAETPFDDYEHGQEETIRRISALSLKSPPGTRFIYSDIGYIVLEEVLRRVTGQNVAEFARDAIFRPLGMTDTEFLLPPEKKLRAAPTEQREGKDWIRGDVHDPRAFRLGGIAGHAGLFSTAHDLVRYAQMILSGGSFGQTQILSTRGLSKLTAPHDVPGGIRAIGWDMQTAYSGNRGTTLSRRAIGHGGYTGTALWIDPEEDLFVLFLSNRVHPDGKGSVNGLAGDIGTLAGRTLGAPRPPTMLASTTVPAAISARAGAPPTSTAPAALPVLGVDVLAAEDFAPLRGLRFGLLTNDQARTRKGERTVDLLASRKDLALVSLFSAEHGLRANRDESIEDGVDPVTRLPVFSLYGKVTAPTAAMLSGLDAMVVDLPDIGARFYTYASTLHGTMRAAAAKGIRVVVLDRPNPLDGVDVAGPILKPTERSFVNHHPLPVRHGMTLGELAEMINADEHLGLDLEIIRMQNYDRSVYFEKTGLAWRPPSPNLRTVNEAVLYPGVALVEGTNVSVGRGTDTPFEVVGAPFVDGRALAAALVAENLAGVSFDAVDFTPKAARYAGEQCHGVRLRVDDRSAFEPVRTGIAIALVLRRLYPDRWDATRLHEMLGDPAVTAAVLDGRPLSIIEGLYKDDLDSFRAKRAKYLLYPL